ncbi:MAG: DUF983 domain-containing protein [Pseudomonadota bacterium]
MTTQYEQFPADALQQARPIGRALFTGLRCRCPNCAEGPIFDGYLTVRESCPSCGQELHHHQADDAPPYFATFIVGHIVVSLVLMVEVAYQPPLWVHMALWLPLTTALSLVCLRPIKGAIVAYQWALRMHGFETDPGGRLPANRR